MVILFPLGGVFKRCFAVLALVILQLGENEGKLIVIEDVYLTAFGVDNGNGFAPVALAGKYPLSEMIIGGARLWLPWLPQR